MTPTLLLLAVAAHFDLSVATLRSRDRTRYVVQARQAAAWVLRTAYPALGLVSVGELLGRDHTTIIYSLSAVEDRMEADPLLAAQLLSLVALAQVPASAAPQTLSPGDDRRFYSVKIARTA